VKKRVNIHRQGFRQLVWRAAGRGEAHTARQADAERLHQRVEQDVQERCTGCTFVKYVRRGKDLE